MNAFTAEFLPVIKAAPETLPHSGFTPLSFRRKRMTELCEGYYCLELADGRTEFVEAASALDALRIAQSMGVVTRVQRESLQRRRMVQRLVNPDAAEAEEESLIKPGTVLLSFETLCRWQDRKDGMPAGTMGPEVMPPEAMLASAPVPEFAMADQSFASEAAEEPAPSTAGEVAATILAQVQRPRSEPDGA